MGVGSLPASVLHPARIDRTLVIQWSVFALSIVIVFAPIVPIIYQSFIDRPIYDTGHEATLQNYTNLFSSPELPQSFSIRSPLPFWPRSFRRSWVRYSPCCSVAPTCRANAYSAAFCCIRI